MPAPKLRPTSPSTTTVPPVMYSQQWLPAPSMTAIAPEFRTANRPPAQRQMPVPDVVGLAERPAGLEARPQRGENRVVERLDSGAVVARHAAPPGRVPRLRLGKKQRQVEHLGARHVRAVDPFQQVH